MQPGSLYHSTPEPRFDGMGDELRSEAAPVERVAPPSQFTAKRIEQADWPVHCLPELMRDAVDAASALSQRPPAMAATLALCTAAGVFGANYRYRTAHYGAQPINLFGIIAAIPGQGKTETAKLFRTPLAEADQRIISAHITAKQRWDGMNADQRKAEPELRPRRECPDLLCNNATIQALGRKLSRGRPAMMQIMTEGGMLTGGWSGGNENKSETLANYNALWDAEGVDNLRMGQDRSFKTAVGRILSKAIMGQKMMLDWVLDPKSAFGYTARVLLCNDDNDDLEPYLGNYEDLHRALYRYNTVITAALRKQNDGIELEHTPEWQHIYVSPDYYAGQYLEEVRANDRALTGPDLRDDELDMKAQWQRRRAHQASRIASVLAAFDAAEHGYDDHVVFYLPQAEQAMEIADWYHGELGRLIDMAGDTEVAADSKVAWTAIGDHIRRAIASGKTEETPNVREVLRKRRPFKGDPERIDRVIARLEVDGAIGRAPPEPGKKSARWTVYWRWD